MKTNFKSVIAGLALAMISSPLFAAPVVRVAVPTRIEVLAGSVVDSSPLIQDLEIPCTATTEVSIGGLSVSFSVTASTCKIAFAELARQVAEMLQVPAGG